MRGAGLLASLSCGAGSRTRGAGSVASGLAGSMLAQSASALPVVTAALRDATVPGRIEVVGRAAGRLEHARKLSWLADVSCQG
jgi:hypothetical protein